jgi:hypothetical protein
VALQDPATPGKKRLAADALSQRSKLPAALYKLPVTVDNNDEDEDFLADMKARIDDMEAGVHAVMRTEKIKVMTWDRFYEAVQEEPLMVKLMEVVLQGFPQSSFDIYEDLMPYHKYRHELHIAGGVLQEQSCHPNKTKTAGVGGHPRSSPGAEWHDQLGGGVSLLARDITGYYQDQRGLLDLCERS